MSQNLSDYHADRGSVMPGVILLILAVLVGGGYYYYTQNKGAAESAERADMASAAGSEAIKVPPFEGKDVQPGNPVVAKVGGSEITRVDVFNFIQQMPPQMQQASPQQVYPMALEQVINNRLIQLEADKVGYETSDAYKAQLEEAKSMINRKLYLQEKMAASINEEKMKKLYEEKVAQVPDAEERRARHILVETEDEAKKIIEELRGGASFEEMAKQHSKGPTGANGGDLGWFAQGEMVPEFSEVAFKTSPGTLVETPVKTQFGYHVIRVEESRMRAKPTYEQMENLLMAEIQREALTGLVMGLRGKSEIIVYDVNGNVPGAVSNPETEPSAGMEGEPDAPAPEAESEPAQENPEPAPEPAE